MSSPSFLQLLPAQLDRMESMPSVPAILLPVLRYLSESTDTLDMQRVIELIGHDKSLAAQTLHMANSPLFGHSRNIDSVRAAVMALGVSRMRDIVGAASMLRLVPARCAHADPRVFWEHSLGCALVARKLASHGGYPHPEKAYLAGLLHDLGFMVNMLLFPERFAEAMRIASRETSILGSVEQKLFGFDHCLSGEMLAARWSFSPDLQEVVSRHHQPERAIVDPALVAIVCVSDLLCRTSGLGYGYDELLSWDPGTDRSVQTLADLLPKLRHPNWAAVLAQLRLYLKEVSGLVSILFRVK